MFVLIMSLTEVKKSFPYFNIPGFPDDEICSCDIVLVLSSIRTRLGVWFRSTNWVLKYVLIISTPQGGRWAPIITETNTALIKMSSIKSPSVWSHVHINQTSKSWPVVWSENLKLLHISNRTIYLNKPVRNLITFLSASTFNSYKSSMICGRLILNISFFKLSLTTLLYWS